MKKKIIIVIVVLSVIAIICAVLFVSKSRYSFQKEKEYLNNISDGYTIEEAVKNGAIDID